MSYTHSWEQAIEWLRQQPDKQEFVRHCYYDDPPEAAARRFHASEEWQAVKSLLGSALSGKALDIGAGRGIASYALAKTGCIVTALEPSSSEAFGAGAIRSLAENTGVRIEVVQESAEAMPFGDATFDLVYCRAAMHHADNLEQFCMESSRVLKPGGVFLATREHVLTRPEDKDEFFRTHALHFLYGGENAYLRDEYVSALQQAGLKVRRALGPYDSVINHAPMSRYQRRQKIRSIMASRLGTRIAATLVSVSPIEQMMARYLSSRSNSPGRHYSFLGKK